MSPDYDLEHSLRNDTLKKGDHVLVTDEHHKLFGRSGYVIGYQDDKCGVVVVEFTAHCAVPKGFGSLFGLDEGQYSRAEGVESTKAMFDMAKTVPVKGTIMLFRQQLQRDTGH